MKLKDVREKKGLSQMEVAVNAGVGSNTVWRAESGYPVTKANALAICRVLDVSPDETDVVVVNRVTQRAAAV